MDIFEDYIEDYRKPDTFMWELDEKVSIAFTQLDEKLLDLNCGYEEYLADKKHNQRIEKMKRVQNYENNKNLQ